MKAAGRRDEEGAARVESFMENRVISGSAVAKTKEIKASAPKLKPKKVKKKGLLTREYELPFGGTLSRTSRGLNEEEINDHRNVMCDHYNFCNNLAIQKEMPSFSCKECKFFS